ncbi:MAG: 30S ribosomal protein S15 [Elusimicrobia bacterium]|nr:30S ribosomal protein S15 [Elusimicrobiota bacterium]
MTLTKQVIRDTVENFSAKPNDTGSTSVQIALLTERIDYLSKHFSANKKDYASHKGLMHLITQRKKLLSYLSNHNREEYQTLITKLGLRK